MQSPRFGTNRTGVSNHPQLTIEMMENAELFPPSSAGDETDLAAETAVYVAASEALEPEGRLGSVPQPLESAEDVDEDVDEDDWALFLDKLGERLAFERSGVRIYDGLIAKLEAAPDELPQGPDLDALALLRDQELEHFHALAECMLELGADPTAVTPSADVAGLIGAGIGQVIADPRTSLLASLEATLVAELADNECWEGLAELALGVGREELAQRFEAFIEHEQEHLMKVRGWVAAGQGRAQLTTPH